jgi:hypothetical protein
MLRRPDDRRSRRHHLPGNPSARAAAAGLNGAMARKAGTADLPRQGGPDLAPDRSLERVVSGGTTGRRVVVTLGITDRRTAVSPPIARTRRRRSPISMLMLLFLRKSSVIGAEARCQRS